MVDSSETNGEILKDIHETEHKIEEVTEEKYLGDVISKDGKNTKNIKSRVNKGMGSINQIMSILEEICFGNFF